MNHHHSTVVIMVYAIISGIFSLDETSMNGNVFKNQTLNPEQLQQMQRVNEAKRNCTEQNKDNQITDFECSYIWDGIMCWPPTNLGTQVSQSCPHYVYRFNPKANASKFCTENGTWYINEGNMTWTNYTLCSEKHPLSSEYEIDIINPNIEPHIAYFKLLAQIGYSVSFGTLFIALFILTSVKRLSLSGRRLRCPRNNLHLQLFLSFMLRSFLFLIKNLFASPKTSARDQHSAFLYTNYEESMRTENLEYEVPSLSCKIFTSIWEYSLVANYNWILMEGLYLHNLIFFHIFNDNSSIVKYIILGWGLPVLSIVPWVIIRALYEDTHCWTTHKNWKFFWIIRGPITVTIILNFVFFINITRVVFLKMFSSVAHSNRHYRYRKWFKSTLVLVPLFGVHYMVLFIFNSLVSLSFDIEIIWLYTDLLFTSFQGCVVALLYCFCNGEVQQELRKIWQSWKSKNTNSHSNVNSHSNTHHSLITQSLTYLSRGRNSILSSCDNIFNRKDAVPVAASYSCANRNSRSPSPNTSRRIIQYQCPSSSANNLFLQVNECENDVSLHNISNTNKHQNLISPHEIITPNAESLM